MSYLRYSSRNVHWTVANWIEATLTSLNWMDPDNTPFGAPVLRVKRTTAAIGGQLPEKLEPGLVTVTLGDEPMPDEEELGGALSSIEIPIFIDIFMDLDAHAAAVSEDIRDMLLGRLGPKIRVMPTVDQATDDVRTDWSIHFEDIEQIRPEVALAIHWRVVKVTARVYFLEETYG